MPTNEYTNLDADALAAWDARVDTHGEAVSSSQVILWGFVIRDATMVAYVVAAHLDRGLSEGMNVAPPLLLAGLITTFVSVTLFTTWVYGHYSLLSLPVGTPAHVLFPIKSMRARRLAQAAEALLFVRDMLAFGHTFAHLPRALFYLLIIPVFLSTGAVTGQLRFYVIDPPPAALAAADADADAVYEHTGAVDEKSRLWAQPPAVPVWRVVPPSPSSTAPPPPPAYARSGPPANAV